MIKQQLYRADANGGRTIAVSDELRGSAWLPLLEGQLALIDYTALSFPVYYQYPLGRGIVMSRCSVNPYSPDQSFIAHQLILDEAADIDELLSVRPVKDDLLPHGIFGYTETPSTLGCLSAKALCDPEESVRCCETLAALFRKNEHLLGQFFASVSLCARDKRHSVLVLIEDTPANVSEAARQVMEITLRVLPREDVLRLSFCSCCGSSPSMQYTVCFAPKAAAKAAEPFEIRFEPAAGLITLPDGVSLPSLDYYTAQTRASLPDGAQSPALPFSAGATDMKLPSFEEGTSLKQYFARWRAAMEDIRSGLTEEGFRAYAAVQWPNLLGLIITASDQMNNAQFLSDLNGIISVIRREKLESTLSMSDNTLTDLLIILLDSISWRQIDLARPQTGKLMKSISAYSQVLSEDQCPPECLCACRIIYCVLAAPTSIHEALNDLKTLESTSSAQFESLQDCLQQYVENRLTSDIDVIDESLAAAAMLGFARFSDGIPDLRLADKLASRISTKNGSKAARRFEQLLDKLRRHLHSAHPGLRRRRDMKLFLFISLLLLLLIAAITVGFLLLY